MIKRITRKIATFGVTAAAIIVATPGLAFAHVVVTPNEALTGAYQTFTTSVPNEKEIPVTQIRLVIPDSIESSTPTVKPGWTIETKKSGDKVTEITWTGGSIPAEQRDEFTFSAHLPSNPGDINWKAYQTYQDGSVVSWDQKPSSNGHESEDESKGPYSVTTVSDSEKSSNTDTQKNSSNAGPYVISFIALALSIFALVRKNKK